MQTNKQQTNRLQSESRRSFLKSSAFLGSLGCAPLKLSAAALADGRSSVYSICEMCSSRCPIEVSVKNGKATFIGGNPNCAPNYTSVCARGGAGISQLNDPKRLIQPLIRVGERGENKWKIASWDEAFSLISSKLSQIAKEHGPQSVVFSSKAGEEHANMMHFACAYGSPNVFSHKSICPVTYGMTLKHTYGGGLNRDFKNSKYVVSFGHNLFEGIVISETKPFAEFAAREDTKLLVLEPRFSVLAAKADEWLPVRPGTDLAFVMALIHIWLRDGKYDKQFVERYCVGLDELKQSVAHTDAKWQERFTNIPAKTVERIADEIYAAAPRVIIDWGHKTTTTQAEYQRTRAIAIANALMGNFEKAGGIFASKNAKKLNGIIGEELFPTLANPAANFKIPSIERVDGASEPGKNCFVSRSDGSLVDMVEAICTGRSTSGKEYPIKAWVNTRMNALINVPNTNRVREAISKLDFIVSVDVYLNDFSNMADVVLPECSYLERDQAIAGFGSKRPGYYMRNAVVEKIGNTKSGFEIWRELARRMKIDSIYGYESIEQYRMQQAKGNVELLAKLKKDGCVIYDAPELFLLDAKSCEEFVAKYPSAAEKLDEKGLMSSAVKFATPSGKIELFSEQVERAFANQGCLNTDGMDVYGKYEFCLTSGKSAIHTNAHTQNVPVLNDLLSSAPLWINEDRAKELGFKDGDEVIVENENGQARAVLHLTQAIRSDTVFVYHGFGREVPDLPNTHRKGLNDSILLGSKTVFVSSSSITNVGVNIKKA